MNSQLLDYWQKKLFFHYLQLHKKFRKLPFGKRFSLMAFLFVTISYPGQNHWQTLNFNPASSKVNPKTHLVNHLIPNSDSAPLPPITAQAVYVFDPDSGTVLYEKNSTTIMFPASTTKIMTALIALENYDLESPITIKGEGIVGNALEFIPGQQFTVRNILASLLIPSANDAALALADNYKYGYLGFIDQMNQKAKNLHLSNTHYSNVSGIESKDHLTTTHDLALLTKEATKNPLFMELVNTPSLKISDISGENEYLLETTNLLLGKIEGLKGIKTGWTQNAGECLVTYVERDGKKIITVVLNSGDRFTDSTKLIDWAYSHHSWQ